ncbi:MAG: HXXEE domain-containing protein [Thermomicrobiales bacterium]
MNHDWILWVLTIATGIHVMEEHGMGWQGWAVKTMGLRIGVHPTWSDFWATNLALIVVAIACASVAWRAPWFALSFPALCVINAVFFHVLPTVAARRPNPGVFSAVLLYIPISIWIYAEAERDGMLSAGTVLVSTLVGAGLMASAILVLMLSARIGYPDA